MFADFPAALQQVLLATCQRAGGDLRGCDRDVRDARRPGLARAGGRGRPGGHPDRRLGRHRPGWRYHPLLVELLRQRTAPGGPHWPVLTHAHERAARHHRRLGDGAAALHHAGMSRRRQPAAPRPARVHAPAAGTGPRRAGRGGAAPGARRGARQPARRSARSRHWSCAACGGTTPRRRPPTARSRSGLRVATGEPDRELQADLAILEVWQARRGWRPATAAVSHAAEALRVPAPRRRPPPPTHDTSGISPLRSAWLMLDLAALQLWAGDLDLADVHAHAAAATPSEVELPRLTCAVLAAPGLLELAHLGLPERVGSAQRLPRPARAGRCWPADATRSPRAPGARLGALPGPRPRRGRADLAASAGRAPRVPRPVRRRLRPAARGEPADGPRGRGGGPPAAGRPGRHARRGCRRTPTACARLARLQAAGRLGDLGAVDAEANGLRAAGFRGDATLVRALELGVGGERAGRRSTAWRPCSSSRTCTQ